MSPQLLPSPDARPRALPPVKPPRIIVEHFDIATYKVDQAHGYVEADCQHCGATIKGQKNVTSNFIQHMRRRHRDAYDAFAKSSGPRAKRIRISNPCPTPNPITPSRSTPPPAPTPAPDQVNPVPTPLSTTSLLVSPIPAPSGVVVDAPIPPSVPRPPRHTLFPEPAPTSADPNRPEMTMETALVSATYRAAVRTDCEVASALSARTCCQFYIKREDKQVSGTSVFRASYNFLAATPTSRAGLVAAGANALPVAAAAQKSTKPCLCILPNGTPRSVLRKLAAYDAKCEIAGDTDEEASAIAVKKATDLNRTYVDLAGPNFLPGCADAVAGYATLALELLQQRPHTNRVFMSGGNALLFSGVADVLQRLGRGVILIGVVLDASLDEANERGDVGLHVTTPAPPQPIVHDWAAFADGVVRVGQSEMCAAVKFVFDDCDNALLEPAGALAIAGAVKYARVHKLSHERLAAVVDSPLRDFDRLAVVASRALQADGSRCTLCVQRPGDAETEQQSGSGLAQLMQELSGTAGGTARVTSLRFGGGWPLLLGLGCDETTTAGAHVANLTSLGYGAADVTGCDWVANEAWPWNQEDASGDSSVGWGVFRVEILQNSTGVVKFLATDRTDPPLAKVALSYDGGCVARLLVAAKGTDWQLSNLEREMAGQAVNVKRVRSELYGLRVLGCSDPPRVEPAAQAGNGGLVMTSEGTDTAGNAEAMDAGSNAENGANHTVAQSVHEASTVGGENPANVDSAAGPQSIVGEQSPAADENPPGDGEGLAATAEIGMSFADGDGVADGDGDGDGDGAGANESGGNPGDGEALADDSGDGAGEGQAEDEDEAVPSHAHDDDGNGAHEHGHSHGEDVHMHDEGIGSASGGNENEGDNDDVGDDVPPHELSRIFK